ncbi:MAG: DUF3515 family protein [Microcella sp.]
MTRRPARAAGALAAAALLAALTACAPTVALEPADDANAVACAEISVRLPDELLGLERRSTNAQATAAWGNPAAVIYRCGLPPIGATDLPCFTVEGIDWLLDESNAPQFVFLSYGRAPVTEIIVDPDLAGVAGVDVLRALSPAVSAVEATQQCLAATDVLSGGQIAPPAEDEPSGDAPADE